ncbi:hypothetical protein M2459_002585 [Parabacteroides sp. PF5-5]|uniref:DUF4251 domain-containing protein n=1 Tax=unclassified Parabacteroides TaxID=2649774 RepID=UPI00247554CD|nr:MULTISPECIES: DUF4251 domain-containing protein [unclassified Parabacteroides]MDH6305659.1 hypothetical protein [Parabacteroides sp. PH5-39]MDH6316731.1 hypothetical protein [Parabacteroides sp. PF5-13]MDH6320372.1 hypothetical protein [Parabacteroides sp. PH5-13]MDH6324102.1 hypothetical protein [Parabacteroides sp. PH5-8]MDH6327917.1 hypothetical protein [Parabacteroides sp. PH5-41]
MKRFRLRLFLVMGIALFFGGQSLLAQEAKSKKEKKAQLVKELVNGGRYTVEVTRALPMGGRSVNLTSLYSLELRGDSVLSYLPYFGRAYSVPYGGGERMRFTSTMTEHTLSYDKKGTARIIFKTRTDEDSYTFNIQIFKNGSSTIQVTPVNRQAITYQGDLLTEKKE